MTVGKLMYRGAIHSNVAHGAFHPLFPSPLVNVTRITIIKIKFNRVKTNCLHMICWSSHQWEWFHHHPLKGARCITGAHKCFWLLLWARIHTLSTRVISSNLPFLKNNNKRGQGKKNINFVVHNYSPENFTLAAFIYPSHSIVKRLVSHDWYSVRVGHCHQTKNFPWGGVFFLWNKGSESGLQDWFGQTQQIRNWR